MRYTRPQVQEIVEKVSSRYEADLRRARSMTRVIVGALVGAAIGAWGAALLVVHVAIPLGWVTP